MITPLDHLIRKLERLQAAENEYGLTFRPKSVMFGPPPPPAPEAPNDPMAQAFYNRFYSRPAMMDVFDSAIREAGYIEVANKVFSFGPLTAEEFATIQPIIYSAMGKALDAQGRENAGHVREWTFGGSAPPGPYEAAIALFVMLSDFVRNEGVGAVVEFAKSLLAVNPVTATPFDASGLPLSGASGLALGWEAIGGLTQIANAPREEVKGQIDQILAALMGMENQAGLATFDAADLGLSFAEGDNGPASMPVPSGGG
jgi:hypothetical protein